MEIEKDHLDHEGQQDSKVFEAAGGYSQPSYYRRRSGLIHVMENLSDPSKLGSGIAVAFVATVYGVSLGEPVFSFRSRTKLKLKHQGAMTTEGNDAGRSDRNLEGINPRIIEDKLKGYLAHEERKDHKDAKSKLELRLTRVCAGIRRISGRRTIEWRSVVKKKQKHEEMLTTRDGWFRMPILSVVVCVFCDALRHFSSRRKEDGQADGVHADRFRFQSFPSGQSEAQPIRRPIERVRATKAR